MDDVTVVMPIYERLKYLTHYVDEGFWEGLNVQIVCDGSPVDVVRRMEQALIGQQHMNIHRYGENKGVAFARKTGINLVKTPFLSFCDDDDFLRHAHPFLQASKALWNRNPKALFTAMPRVFAFNESLELKLQYDRTAFDQKTGRELLGFLVRTGEMCVLTLGAVFRTETLKGIEPESFFKVSEDFVFLARLCARYPDRRIHVTEQGAYMRLIQEYSLSSRTSYSLEKLVMHLISMFVGAFYLIKMGELHAPAFQQILLNRGEVLQSSYGKGTGAARYMASLMGYPVREKNEEFWQAKLFVEKHRPFLPAEFCRMVGWSVPAGRLE